MIATKYADKVVKTGNGYKVRVYDNGWCFLCDYIDYKWQDLVFATEEEATERMNLYNDYWKHGGFNERR